MGRPSLKRKAAPRATHMVARVMMNGGIRVVAAQRPLNAPNTAATPSPAATARSKCHALWASTPPSPRT